MKYRVKHGYCGGIDVGGTKVSSALFTPDGRMLGRKKIPIDQATAEGPVRQITRLIHGLEAKAREKGGELHAIGICIPGIVFGRSGRVWTLNVPGWKHFPLRDRLAVETKKLLVLDSDRSAYVLGEQWRGVARGKKDVVFLAVGTGIGAGILSGGRLVRGSGGIAGAVGWFALDPRLQEEYAAMGGFEAEASGGSIGRKAREFLRTGELSLIGDLAKGNIEGVTAKTVAAAARAGDPLARHILDRAVIYLAMGIANIVSILNPEMIVLGGGLFQAADLLFGPVRKEFRRWAQPLAAQKVRIELSALGDEAGLYGAAKLAWDSKVK
ncbi:MAG: ROK family protein [Candidatus Aminicenantales bacterium]